MSAGPSHTEFFHTGLLDHDQDPTSVRDLWSSHDQHDEDETDHHGIGKLMHGLKALATKVKRKLRERVHHMHDVMSVYHEVSTDLTDTAQHPELEMDAELRRNNDLSPQETAFIAARKQHVLQTRALHRFLRLPDGESVHPDDIPICAIGGSGGGYRACLGYLAMMEAMQVEGEGLWDLVFYASGVSGSCWSLAALYTIGGGDAATTLRHFGETSAHHPLSPTSIHAVGRSPKGVYFQIGPMLQKIRVGKVEATIMDLYSTLTTTHILLSRTDPATGMICFPPSAETDKIVKQHADNPGDEVKDGRKAASHPTDGPHPRLEREWFRWTGVTKKAGIDRGLSPLPIFAACRHERPWRNWKSDTDPFDDIDQASKEHDRADAWWQWFEISPFEFGSDELEGWIPTWAFGRAFSGGKSDPADRVPERSLSLLLGISTSALAAPLSAWIETLARNLPQNSFGETIKSWGTSWAKKHPKGVEKFMNHHPVHAVNEPNPFYRAEKEIGRGQGFENSPRVHLVDAGMGNNLPTYVFFRPHRNVDVAFLGDYSSDVQKGAAIQRIQEGGLQKGLDIRPRVVLPPLPPLTPQRSDPDEKPKAPTLTGQQIQERFKGRYAQVLDARPNGPEQMAEWQRRKAAGELQKWELDDFKVKQDGIMYNDKNVPLPTNPASLVYLPLLPNKVQPDYDPSTASFSSSYNLTWTKEQVDTIRATGMANIRDSLDTIREAVREVYERKKAARLGQAGEAREEASAGRDSAASSAAVYLEQAIK